MGKGLRTFRSREVREGIFNQCIPVDMQSLSIGNYKEFLRLAWKRLLSHSRIALV